MAGHNEGWASRGVQIYYLLGAAYYIYQWLIVGGFGGVVASIITAFLSSYDLTAAIVGALSFLILLVGIVIYISSLTKRYRGLNPGLKLLRSSTTYKILENGYFEYIRGIEAKVSFHAVNDFTHIITWSGRGKLAIDVDEDFRSEIVEDPTSSRTKLMIHFPRPYSKGEVVKFSYRISMHDDEGIARNFLRSTIYEKVRHMSLRVYLAPSIKASEFRRAIYMSGVSEIPVFEHTVPIDRGGMELSWDIDKPRLEHAYCIIW